MVWLLLVVGFILLVKGADLFVDGSAALADRFKIPAVIIGLTVVAFGTSAPETAVSISAAMKGSNDIAVANVVGSNLFNLLMVIGISSLISPITVKRSILKSEFPLSIAVTGVLLVLCLIGKVLGRIDGIVLLVVFALFLYNLIRQAINANEESGDEIKKMSLIKSLVLIVVGLTAIVIGGDVVVDNAQKIAKMFGMSDMLIGLTIVAIGTSLPELVTSVVAAVKGQNDIAVGNVVGSNIFNVLLVLGISSAITPIAISAEAVVDMIILIGVSALCFIQALSRGKVSRIEGLCMVAVYIAYTAYIIMR